MTELEKKLNTNKLGFVVHNLTLWKICNLLVSTLGSEAQFYEHLPRLAASSVQTILTSKHRKTPLPIKAVTSSGPKMLSGSMELHFSIHS